MFFEILKAIVFGIVEGITEWLPVSSTGHLILLNEFLTLKVSEAFQEMFDVVIQLGAIFAVLVLFFHKLNPFSPKKSQAEKNGTWTLWFKVVLAVLPSAVLGLAFDDWFDAHFYNYTVVALMLIVYGIAFLWVEEKRPAGAMTVTEVDGISWRTALLIGAFQCLALIPGTSRSGATILGGILLGVSRSAASEFSFFLAIPTMLGASALKALKFFLEGNAATSVEIAVLITGMIVSFLVSIAAIRGLMEYVRKHKFSLFGIYRIVLGVIVLGYALVRRF
ncbi:MAG: undecaprenyl-diphosphate phosphatase [Oscillospiraceae bacterium]|nr:undecaprenyl-diphosphate phosphatase [Oscillospiraceae bacterium]